MQKILSKEEDKISECIEIEEVSVSDQETEEKYENNSLGPRHYRNESK